MLDGINTLGNTLEAYLNLLSGRQKLTASNIANTDTPGSKTKDIDFEAELASALEGGNS